MRRLPAPWGLRTVVVTFLIATIGSGCASSGRNALMAPTGPRLLGRADPIAAGRPPAITFDPYQPDGIPRPTGLARYFPGPSVAAPAAAKPAGPVDRSPSPAPPTAIAERVEPVSRARASRATGLARATPRSGEILPIGITLETFPASPSAADPETRLASRRAGDEPGAFELPVVEEIRGGVAGPADVPDFRRDE